MVVTFEFAYISYIYVHFVRSYISYMYFLIEKLNFFSSTKIEFLEIDIQN